MRKIEYNDTLYESNMRCGRCKAWLGRVEYDATRGNPHHQWPIKAGTPVDPKVIQELGL